jgi:hypothetical protein
MISCFPKSWLLLALTTIKPVSDSLISSVWALRKCCSAKMSSSKFSRTVFLYNVFEIVQGGIVYIHIMRDGVAPLLAGAQKKC